jgi:hypothetical protein
VPDALAQAVLAEKEHRDVEIQVILLDINEVSSVSESFEANVPYLLTWQDPTLAHEGTDSISKRLDAVFPDGVGQGSRDRTYAEPGVGHEKTVK